VPRHAPDVPTPRPGIEQKPARSGRIAYSIAALRTAVFQKVDVVFCGHLFLAPLAALIARLKAAKLIVQMHGIEAWPRPSRTRRAALETADMVLCVSRHTRAAVLEWASIAPERLVVVPNTVRDVFTPGDRSAMRAALAIESKRVLLTVGSMDSGMRYKGQDRVIEAIPELVAKGYDICYLVAGEGDDRVRLEALARAVGVSERVRFLGPIELQELAETYRMADLFVMPSTGEGFGIVFLEAMASGTPALGLGVAGAKDALADGQLGTVTSSVGLPGAIARMLDAPKPDPQALAAQVRSRFGPDTFSAASRAAIGRLIEATGS
jgi:phosphatidylinositol alpha-1,6-mannosyltransferase